MKHNEPLNEKEKTMNLDQIEEVTRLKNHRQKAIDLRKIVSKAVIGCAIEGQDVFSVISAEYVRAAIDCACTDSIIATEKKLSGLRVGVKNPEPTDVEGTAESWRSWAMMLQGAWLRELGGKLIRKSHFIDALVLTTREMREKAESRPKPEIKKTFWQRHLS